MFGTDTGLISGPTHLTYSAGWVRVSDWRNKLLKVNLDQSAMTVKYRNPFSVLSVEPGTEHTEHS